MNIWELDIPPESYAVRYKDARYAVLLVMAADGDLGDELHPDCYEMTKGVSEDVAALVLVDYPGEGVSRVLEVLPRSTVPVHNLEEISTGDPRPIADFLARALVSFTPETRFAVGFWGHGLGAFGDLDPDEIVLRQDLRFGPLGAPIIDEEATTERVLHTKKRLIRSMLPDVTSDNALTNREASSALTVAFSRAGRTEPVDMLFFDTCLNGSVEVFTELRRFAKTFVASSLPIPGTGWRYDYWLSMTGEAKPETPEKWAYLAVKLYEIAYDQRVCKEPAHLVATNTEIDFIEPLGELIRALVARGVPGAVLVAEAARRALDIYFGENRELHQMVRWIRDLTDDEEIRSPAQAFLDRHQEATICASMDPPDKEGLSGMTIWCPLLGDTEHVASYYRNFEFNRLTGWSDLIEIDVEKHAEVSGYSVYAFHQIELVKACEVDRMGTAMEDDELRLCLSVPKGRARFAAGLVEGEYRILGKPMVIQFPNNVVLRELHRLLQELGENYEFEALEGCHKSGWLAAGSVCAELLEHLEKREEEFMEAAASPLDRKAFRMMRNALKRVGPGGVMLSE